MQGFISNYFNNSYKDMVNFFVQQKKLKSKDLKDIIEMIENKKKIKLMLTLLQYILQLSACYAAVYIFLLAGASPVDQL